MPSLTVFAADIAHPGQGHGGRQDAAAPLLVRADQRVQLKDVVGAGVLHKWDECVG